MKKILLYIGAAFLSLTMLIFVSAFLLISFLDVNNYRDEITASLSKSLGQEVKIYGVFDVQLSFYPSATITDIEIGDSKNPIVKVQNFYAKVSLLSLLTHPVIEKLTLQDAVIRLETKDGKSNLGGGGKSESKSHNGGNFLADLPIIKSANIKNVQIYSTDHDAKTSFEVPINSIIIGGHKGHTDINANIGNMKSNKKSLGGLTMKAYATHNSFIVESIKQGKAISGNLEYYHNSKISSDIKLNGFSMEVLDILTGNKFGLSGQLDGNIKLNATGKSKKSLMKSLKGQVNLKSDKVIIKKSIPYLEILNLANLGVQTSGCVILNAPIENGIASVQGASVLNIGDIKTNGQINLAKEKIDITNNIDISLPIFTASGDVKITGDLDNPKIQTSDFSDVKIDGKGIIKNIAKKPEEAVEQLGGFLKNLVGQGGDSQEKTKATNLQACQKLLKS